MLMKWLLKREMHPIPHNAKSLCTYKWKCMAKCTISSIYTKYNCISVQNTKMEQNFNDHFTTHMCSQHI